MPNRIRLFKNLSFVLSLVGFFYLSESALGKDKPVPQEDPDRPCVTRNYDKKQPGFLSPAEYIALAKKAAHDKWGAQIAFHSYHDGHVIWHSCKNFPPAKRDAFEVRFVYRGLISGGGLISGSGAIMMNKTPRRPVLVVLIRPNLSERVVYFE